MSVASILEIACYARAATSFVFARSFESQITQRQSTSILRIENYNILLSQMAFLYMSTYISYVKAPLSGSYT